MKYDLEITGDAKLNPRIMMTSKKNVRRNVDLLADILLDLPREIVDQSMREKIHRIRSETIAEVMCL